MQIKPYILRFKKLKNLSIPPIQYQNTYKKYQKDNYLVNHFI